MKNIITFDQMTIALNKVFPETKQEVSLLASQTNWEFINLCLGESSAAAAAKSL